MKAIRIHGYGGAEALRFESAPDPDPPGAGDAVVKLEAASVNRSDLPHRLGGFGAVRVFPLIPGSDGAGTVVDVGASVSRIKAGDAVCIYPLSGCGDCVFCGADREFMCPAPRVLGEGDTGTYAGYIRVPARNCLPTPRGISWEEAAALPTVYLTAWRMLMHLAELKPGDTVLILGAGGGVATATLQLARHAGARVIVTSRNDEKLAKARAFGAAHTINTTKNETAAEARRVTAKRGVDVMVDCVGGRGWARSLAALAKGGRLVTCGATAGTVSATDLRRLFWNQLRIFGSRWGSREEFHRLLRFIEFTGTRPIIDRVFPLRDAAAAQQRLDAGEQFGKIALRIDA